MDIRLSLRLFPQIRQWYMPSDPSFSFQSFLCSHNSPYKNDPVNRNHVICFSNNGEPDHFTASMTSLRFLTKMVFFLASSRWWVS